VPLDEIAGSESIGRWYGSRLAREDCGVRRAQPVAEIVQCGEGSLHEASRPDLNPSLSNINHLPRMGWPRSRSASSSVPVRPGALQRSRELTQGSSPKSDHPTFRPDRQERGLFGTVRVKPPAVRWCAASEGFERRFAARTRRTGRVESAPVDGLEHAGQGFVLTRSFVRGNLWAGCDL
jgi:hypothetical protein